MPLLAAQGQIEVASAKEATARAEAAKIGLYLSE